jgi:hypothetical protein
MSGKRFTAGAALVLVLTLFAGAGSVARQGAASISKSDTSRLGATEEILKNVSRLRGLDVKQAVKSGLKSKDEIERAVIHDLEESTTPEEFAATSKTLLKLGLIPKGFNLREYVVKLLREQVAGYYEPKTQEFFLAAWIPLTEQKTVMAHELVHALQDQHFNLRRFERWPKGDSDAEAAAHALVEGEATLVMYQYAFEQQGLRLDLTAIGSLTEKLLEQSDTDDSSKYPVLSAAPSVLRESLQFPYIYGTGFVQEVLTKRSWQALNQSYDRLPASTEQIMHPERFLIRDNPVKIDLADLQPALGADWKRADIDVNGEFGYLVLLAEFIGRRHARTAAEGWGGDRYALYENGQGGSLLLSQFTTWDTQRDAKEFFDYYSQRTEKRYKVGRAADQNAQPRVYETHEGLAAIELRDRDVVIVEGAKDREQLARLLEKLWQSKKSTSAR